ncbi:MAG: hypothetical protein EXR98_11610 [Gemmataceae bacterium]|nr:hypothetical protein [Gemmataceae bacterium]
MPPRLITGAILAFWLGMTGWLLYREVMPAMLAEVSPSYMPDFTEELSTPVVTWTIFRDGVQIGHANSRIGKMGAGFQLNSSFHFNEKVAPLELVESVDLVSDGLKLQGFRYKFVLTDLGTFEVKGKVIDDAMEPKLFVNGAESKLLDLGKIDMGQQSSFVSTLNLVNRLRYLHEGQTWKVHSFDPSSSIQKLGGGDLFKLFAVPPLIAQVKTGDLPWDGKDIPCYKIEYREAGKDVTARTWARRLDGLVLRQELSLFGINMVFERMTR